MLKINQAWLGSHREDHTEGRALRSGEAALLCGQELKWIWCYWETTAEGEEVRCD